MYIVFQTLMASLHEERHKIQSYLDMLECLENNPKR